MKLRLVAIIILLSLLIFVGFKKVSADKNKEQSTNRETAAEYGIRSIPTLMIFENGELVGTEIGALSKLQLEEFIRSKI